MKTINPDRHYKGNHTAIYFGNLSDEEIQDLVVACEEELELRSQEHMEGQDNE